MICPQCTNEVLITEAQYLSMYTCVKCQAVYFIDMMGQPEFGDMSVAEEEPTSAIEPTLTLERSLSEDVIADINSFEESALPPQESLSVFDLAADEITDFANQDSSISILSYDLKITGLDTKETMLLFREAVEDSKFGWMPQNIFSKIKNGECEFKDLNPVQAFVLAQRIQFLDIEMIWSQNVQV